MKKIFETAYASKEERAKVKKCLNKGKIKFYETPTTEKSPGAFWVKKENDYVEARQIIERYQRALANISRKEYESRLKRDFDGSELNWFIFNIKKNKPFIGIGVALVIFLVWRLIAYVAP